MLGKDKSVCNLGSLVLLDKVKNKFGGVLFFIILVTSNATRNNIPIEVFLIFCNESNSNKSWNKSHIQNVKQNINKVVFKNV